MQAVRIDSNAPFDMFFKYELDTTWQCVTISNQIREASKHLKDNKNKKRKTV